MASISIILHQQFTILNNNLCTFGCNSQRYLTHNTHYTSVLLMFWLNTSPVSSENLFILICPRRGLNSDLWDRKPAYLSLSCLQVRKSNRELRCSLMRNNLDPLYEAETFRDIYSLNGLSWRWYWHLQAETFSDIYSLNSPSWRWYWHLQRGFGLFIYLARIKKNIQVSDGVKEMQDQCKCEWI